MRRSVTLLFLVFCLAACRSTSSTSAIQHSVSQYFDIYSNRADFDAFMSFYAEDAQLQDLVYGNHIRGKEALREFFRWDADPIRFEGSSSLVISEQVIQGNQVVTRGHFVEFDYLQQKMGPWRFVIWQEFNERGKIIRQEDWINYTPKESFSGGQNLNNLILKMQPD